MADTEFGTNDVQTVKRWSTSLAVEAIGNSLFARLARRGTSNTFIKYLTDLERAAGDQVKHHLRSLASGAGRYGAQRLEDFEEEMKFPQDSLNINQLRQGHRYDQMSQQRVTFELRSEARDSLSDWYTQAIETIAMCKLAGTVGVETLPIGDVNLVQFDGNTLRAPTTSHRIQNGGASGSTFTLDLVHKLEAKAKTLNPRIRPVNIDGGLYYALIMRPESVYQLKIETGATKWTEIQARAGARGSNNPIFQPALGVVSQTILYSSDYLPADLTSGAETCYSLFLGREAGSFAMGGRRTGRLSRQSGQMFSWVEDDSDYQDKMGVGAASIFGIQKNQFDANDDGTATDYAVIRVETEDPAV